MTIPLYCFVIGDSPKQNVFHVDVDLTSRVSHLKEVIKEKKRPNLEHLSADRLVLYAVSISIGNLMQAVEESALLGPHFEKREMIPVEELSQSNDIWAPNGIFEASYIHILVQTPQYGKSSLASRVHYFPSKLKLLLLTQKM